MVSVSADKTKNHIGFLSVLANKKFEFIGDYRYRPIRKKAYRSPTNLTYQKIGIGFHRFRAEARKKMKHFLWIGGKCHYEYKL